MVKFYENVFTYDYSFPAVTLAYFLRYPNPYSKHVLCTDVIDRYLDPETGRLHTTRLHLKRSKVPSAVFRLIPSSLVGAKGDASQSFILEKSVVDIRQGWMHTESRNLEWTGVLSVVEEQLYRRPSSAALQPLGNGEAKMEHVKEGTTEVTTTVTFHSRLGHARARTHAQNGATAHHSYEEEPPADESEAPAKKGFFQAWSTSSIQRSIEIIGVRRSGDMIRKSKEGMKVVLERLREGGLVGVIEGMRQDRADNHHHEGPWKAVWRAGQDSDSDGPNS